MFSILVTWWICWLWKFKGPSKSYGNRQTSLNWCQQHQKIKLETIPPKNLYICSIQNTSKPPWIPDSHNFHHKNHHFFHNHFHPPSSIGSRAKNSLPKGCEPIKLRWVACRSVLRHWFLYQKWLLSWQKVRFLMVFGRWNYETTWNPWNILKLPASVGLLSEFVRQISQLPSPHGRLAAPSRRCNPPRAQRRARMAQGARQSDRPIGQPWRYGRMVEGKWMRNFTNKMNMFNGFIC